MEFVLQNLDVMRKLKNDGLFRSLFWQLGTRRVFCQIAVADKDDPGTGG